ncbi:MAG: glycosyltransferase family 2 protein [Chloroherpetonaceae bacterium]|nr:glycosyltransferase family 2 protein [Chloroherpetonaceae bacterium]MDW8438339.1 glycosyltransferase family 2 protein [Chloroherpetonaceae bacterium]
MRRRSISCAIICHNAEALLQDCLESVKWCDEVVVVDSFSEDRTLEIAQTFTPLVFQRRFDGFGTQRLFSFSKTSCEWILYIDADERLSPELQTEIQRLLSQDVVEANGYEMPRLNLYFGGAVRHGEIYPDYQLRLFRRDRFTMEPLAVHESAKVRGPVGRLKGDLIHLTATDWNAYKRKQEFYASIEAEKKFRTAKPVSALAPPLRAVAGFVKKFALKKSVLDGRAGLIYAYFHARDRYLLYKKMRALQRENAKS